MKTQEQNFTDLKLNGIFMLLFNIALTIGVIVAFVLTVNGQLAIDNIAFAVLSEISVLILTFIFWAGFVYNEPNDARVMIFFGKYEGSIKENGYFWVNPFYSKKKLTLRARNLDAEPIKVNDKTGNPIMIGLVVVWRVTDTYKASFDIDNASMSVAVPGQPISVSLNQKMKAYENFVKIQSESALRHVAGLYAYDHSGTTQESELTLRSSGDEVTKILELEINERLAIAGIEVVEARLNYLANAPEIAAVMLRRQQADAIISAREKIVDGAVGMVKMALKKLSEENIIDLDEDKKAAMVSNLMVVLCSEEGAKPVLNTGTLNH